MTDEKAREVLGDVRAYLASRASLENEMLASHTFTDICNAIKALEQEPCEDCISRAEALKAIEKEKQGWEGAERYAIDECHTRIAELPPVTPQQTRWIPVSERLPEEYIHVLCQFTLGGMGECYLAHGVFHVVGGLVMTCNEVIAWMPLPQPYKAESEDEE